MTRWFNILFQLMGFGASVVAPQFIADPAVLHTTVGVISIAQGLVAIRAHSYNPDGTSAKTAWVPKEEKERAEPIGSK